MLPRVLSVLRLQQVGSTQDVAIRLVKHGERWVDAVRAERQSAARGRWGADWHSGDGNLGISYILWDLHSADHAAILTLAAACAVAKTVEDFLEPGEQVRVRWPNDVLVGEAKVAGLLAEVVRDPDGNPVIVLGVGLNVNEILFPPKLRASACSLRQLRGEPTNVDEVEFCFWEGLREREPRDLAETVAEFRIRDCSTGREVRALDGRIGVAAGVSNQGLLRVVWSNGVQEELPATALTLHEEPRVAGTEWAHGAGRESN